jgi:hypothetical protein
MAPFRVSLRWLMKRSTVILATLALTLLGCSSRQKTQQGPILGASKHTTTINITESLRAVPVPVPKTTPYDADARKKGAYLSGFRDGWEKGITGMLKYATFGSPSSLSPDLTPSWTYGWKAGSKAGADRWFEELGRVLDALRTNKPAAGKARPTPQLAIGSRCSGLPESDSYA